ncbi:MAG: hypothetical protein IJ801_10570 [Lachnospiraceae bacterium]|nr:hypothetical protein [Lachnospiraceae bacterium]
MVDQNTFMETVRAVAEIIRTAESPLSEEEILGYFEDMELDAAQKKIVMEYLKNPDTGKQEQEGEAESESGQSAVFRMYLDELSRIPEYSDEERDKLYDALLQGDRQVIARIADAWLGRVLEIAEGYIEPKLHVEDLVQEGNMALLVMLQELCGTQRECDPEDILAQAVEEGIASYASEMNGERELENAVLGRVNLVHEARRLLAEENGKLPTIEELSEYTKLSVEELNDIMDMIEAGKEA